MIKLEEYLANFIPSLENFCSKSPLQLKVSVVKETGDIELSSIYDTSFKYTFTVNPLKDKKTQIKEIKTSLEKNYPVVFSKLVVQLSKEEQEEKINEGLEIRKVLDMRKVLYLPRYKILRVHNKYNEIDAVDFKRKKIVKFKLSIPLTSFLNNLFFMSREELSDYFVQKTRIMYSIEKKE